MPTLFRITTDNVALSWSRARGVDPSPFPQSLAPLGRLEIHPRRADVRFGDETWRATVPSAIAHAIDGTVGPRLYEQTDYRIYARVEGSSCVRIQHRDPLIVREVVPEEDGRVVHGNVNFGSQVGRSLFSVFVDDRPEFDFEVEVFPTKLDYESDYRQMLADVQDMLSGLVIEYLRATYHAGFASHEPQPTRLEWLVLLRHILGDVETSLQQIARRPIRGMQRQPVVTRVERIRRLDHTVRLAIQRGSGRGPLLRLGSGRYVRERIAESQTRTTLDTPEHRWLSAQLDMVRRRLGWLRHEESAREKTERREHVIRELTGMETRIARLCRLEPFVEATGDPPAGFASLQLLGAPGYREAYRAALILSLGLRIEGGPLQLSVKDLSLLYEYWCYLALLRLISEETGVPVPGRDFLAISQRGVQVRLQKGRETATRFEGPSGRRVTVTYNRLFSDDSADKVILVPQQPDIVVSVEDPNWPRLHLLIDAKYRVDASSEYVSRYGTPGPPEDAINVLHRYRDAILERVPGTPTGDRPQRTVVEAAAAFPFHETNLGAFGSSSLWRALDRLGVGAVPLLPGSIDYLRQWLRSALRRGGWSMADHAIPHRAHEQAYDWRVAAAEPVLVGVLRGEDPREHFDWIAHRNLYYLRLSKRHGRQLVARWVAIYSPSGLGSPGAVTHVAPVLGIDVMPRRKIATPWASSRDPEELQVVYVLGELQPIRRSIQNRDPEAAAQPMRTHRWTTRLALERACNLKELALETEPEWRLYEDFLACGIEFQIRWRRPETVSTEDPIGRAWFVIAGGPRIRYAGASGFEVLSLSGEPHYLPSSEAVLGEIDLPSGQ